MVRSALAILTLFACTPRATPTIAVEKSACETAVLPAPRAGPAYFDAFLAEYTRAQPDARTELAARFVAARKFPLVEADGTVVFFHVGPARDVRVIGDFRAKSSFKVDWDLAGERLTAVGAIWFARMQFHPEARLDYQLVIDGKAAPDPLNPRTIESGIAGPASELVMPNAKVPVVKTDVPHGSLTTLEWQPKVTIYLPPGYDRTKRYPVVYTADGAAWRDIIKLPAILDELIARQAIAPVIAVMIDAHEDRSTWYLWNPDYLRYLDKVVAYVDAHYPTRADARGRLHVGTSAGGRASLQVGLARPAQFENIAMLSPSFTGFPHIFEPYFSGRSQPPSALRVWMSAGTYEGTICEDARTMARWFRAAGVATKTVYTREGHSFGTWRNVAADMLTHFFADARLR